MSDPSLRDRIAAALREAAHLCDDSCDLADEAACDAAHPIQPTVLHFDVVTDIAGPVDAIADALVGVVQDEIDRAEAALQGVREARSLGEALAAVAEFDGLTVAAEPAADPQPVSDEFFAALQRATAVESTDLHGWYAAMDDDAPATAVDPGRGIHGLLEHVGIDLTGRTVTVNGQPIDDPGTTTTEET